MSQLAEINAIINKLLSLIINKQQQHHEGQMH